MAEETKRIGEITEEDVEALRRLTAYMLPDSPAAAGLPAAVVKKYFYQWLIDNKQSIVALINRIVGETNNRFDDCADKTALETALKRLNTAVDDAELYADRAQKCASEAEETILKLIGELGVVQKIGGSATAVMSQAAVTDVLKLLGLALTKYTIQTSENGNAHTEFLGYIDGNGDRQPTEAWQCTDFIKVKQGEIVSVYSEGYTTVNNIAFYDANKNFVSGVVANATYELVDTTIIIPNGVEYVRGCLAANRENSNDYYFEHDSFVKDTMDIDRIDNEIKGKMFADIITNYEQSIANSISNAFVDTNGAVQSTNSFRLSDFIKITNKDRFDFKLYGTTSVSSLAFYDAEKAFISGIVTDTNGLFERVQIISPSNAQYVRYSVIVGDGFESQYFTHYKSRVEWLEIDVENFKSEKQNPLEGKILVATGDSITAATYSNNSQSYAYMIAEKNGMVFENKAIWGSVIPSGVVVNGNELPSVLSTIDTMRADADFVILSGGINDWTYLRSGEESFGEINSWHNEANINESKANTFCGAFELMLRKAILKWHGKTILFVIEHRMTHENEAGKYFSGTIYPAIKKMCEKWGVPYVDLFTQTAPLGVVEELKNLYTWDSANTGVGDGWHPNAEGYRKYYVPLVEAKLKEIAKC